MKTPHSMMVLLTSLLTSLPAMAQNPPASTVYGTLDAGVVVERGCAAPCAAHRIASGVLTLGRQYSLLYEALAGVADPFHGAMPGAATNLAGPAVWRVDHIVKYVTPTVRGWSAGALYSFGESAFSNQFNRAYGAVIGFEQAPLTVRVAHQRRVNLSDATGVVPMVDNASRNTLIAANLALRHATVYAGFGVNRGFGSAPYDPVAPYGTLVVPALTDRSRDLLAGLAIPYGNATFLLSYLHQDDRSQANRDVTQLAAGVAYALSKRTSLYTAFGKIDHRNGARYTVGNAADRGRGNRALTIVLRHAF